MSLILVNPYVRVKKTRLKRYRKAYSYLPQRGRRVRVKKTRLKSYRKAYMYYKAASPTGESTSTSTAANPWKPKAVKAAKRYLGIGASFAVINIIDLFIRRSKMTSPAPLKLSSIAAFPLPVVTWPLNTYNIIRNVSQIGVRAVPIIGAFKDDQPATALPPPGPMLKGIGGNYY